VDDATRAEELSTLTSFLFLNFLSMVFFFSNLVLSVLILYFL